MLDLSNIFEPLYGRVQPNGKKTLEIFFKTDVDSNLGLLSFHILYKGDPRIILFTNRVDDSRVPRCLQLQKVSSDSPEVGTNSVVRGECTRITCASIENLPLSTDDCSYYPSCILPRSLNDVYVKLNEIPTVDLKRPSYDEMGTPISRRTGSSLSSFE